jgi:hypothetical protein
MILSVEPRSVKRVRRSRMDGDSVAAPSAVPRTTQKEYLTQSVTKMSESKYKVTDTIYNVITYDRNGKIDVSTNIRYLDYIV